MPMNRSWRFDASLPVVAAAGMILTVATAATAEGWTASMTVTGDASGVYAIEGEALSTFADARGIYFVADAYAEGFDAGGIDCADLPFMEIDFFFGREQEWEGHVLFSYDGDGSQGTVVDPTLFFSTLNARGEADETYANYDTVTLAIADMTCTDGALSMDIRFKGDLTAGYGDGTGTVTVSGMALSRLTLNDLNDY